MEKFKNILMSFEFDLFPEKFKGDHDEMQKLAQADFNDLNEEEILEVFHIFVKKQKESNSYNDYNLNDFDVFFYGSDKKCTLLFNKYYEYFWKLYIENKLQWSKNLHERNIESGINGFSKNVVNDFSIFTDRLQTDIENIKLDYVKSKVVDVLKKMGY